MRKQRPREAEYVLKVAQLLSSSFGVQFRAAHLTPKAPTSSCSFMGSLNLGSREKETKDVHFSPSKAFTDFSEKGLVVLLWGPGSLRYVQVYSWVRASAAGTWAGGS